MATYADLEALPENLIGELLEGELFASPRPRFAHNSATSNLSVLLGGPFGFGIGGPGGWRIGFEPELHLDENVLVPDLAGWRLDRLPKLPTGQAAAVAPDWICELLWPSTDRLDRVRKRPVYAAYGVTHAWLADPLQRTIEVYRLSDQGKYLLLAVADGEKPVQLEPFEAVPLTPASCGPEQAENSERQAASSSGTGSGSW